MAFDKVTVPEGGAKVTATNGVLNVPDNPILLFIEGDGIGYDIMTASKRIWDAAVEKAYGGNRKIAWMEIYAGEKAAEIYDGNYMPEETFDALREFQIGIKGPLTTPVGGGFRSLNVTLRQVLDLYSCVRPVRWYRRCPQPAETPGRGRYRHLPREYRRHLRRDRIRSRDAGKRETGEIPARRTGRDRFFEGAGLGIKPISEFGSKRLIRAAIQLRHGSRA